MAGNAEPFAPNIAEENQRAGLDAGKRQTHDSGAVDLSAYRQAIACGHARAFQSLNAVSIPQPFQGGAVG